ncbi:MAG: hypothetical protein ACHQUC_05820 [Chlamydiales bacterium]
MINKIIENTKEVSSYNSGLQSTTNSSAFYYLTNLIEFIKKFFKFTKQTDNQVTNIESRQMLSASCENNEPITQSMLLGIESRSTAAKVHGLKEFYNQLFSELPNLQLSETQLNEFIDSYIGLSKHFELNTEIAPQLRVILKKINEEIADGGSRQSEKEAIKQLVNEMILFNALIPVKITRTGIWRIQRRSIEITTPMHMQKVLYSLLNDKEGLQSNRYLGHIDPTHYSKSSLIEKMIALNLSNLGKEVRHSLLANQFYQESLGKILKSEDPAKWLFACSGGVEQKYLNTCVGAAVCQEVISRLIFLPMAIVLSEQVLEEVVTRAGQPDNKEIYDYFQRRIAMQKESFAKLKKSMIEGLTEKTVDPFRYTEEWSSIMQCVGLLTEIDELGHPTRKLIKNHWLLSVILMIPVVLFQHLFGFSKNPPMISMRAKGISSPHSLAPLGIESRLFTFDMNLIISSLQDSKISAGETKKNMERLWKKLYECAGSCILNESHFFYLKPVIHQGQKLFLLGDPKRDDYEPMDFAVMHRYIIKEKLKFFE